MFDRHSYRRDLLQLALLTSLAVAGLHASACDGSSEAQREKTGVISQPMMTGSYPVQVPIVIDEWVSPDPLPDHERERFGWVPDFQVNIPTFDSENRAFVSTPPPVTPQVGDLPIVQVLTPQGWVQRPITAAAFSDLYPDATSVTLLEGSADRSTKVVFDQEGDAYTVFRIEVVSNPPLDYSDRLVLMHSRDRGQSWEAYDLQKSNCKAYAFEHPWSPEALEGPPAIVAWKMQGNVSYTVDDVDKNVDYGKMWLYVPRKNANGSLTIGGPSGSFTSQGMHFGAHSGAPSMLATYNRRTYIVWGEVPPYPGDPRPSGVPTYIDAWDHDTETFLIGSGRDPITHAPPVDDGHNVPGLVVDTSGRLHVVTGSHGGHFRYLRSTYPEMIDSWDGEVLTTTEYIVKQCDNNDEDNYGQKIQGGCQTYLAFMRDSNDTLHIAYRQWRIHPNHFGGSSYYGALVYQQKPAGGGWSSPQELVVPSIPRYFIYSHKMSIDKFDRLYLLYHHWSKYPPYTPEGTPVNKRAISAMLVTDDTTSWRLVSSSEMAEASYWAPISTLIGNTDVDGSAEVITINHLPRLNVFTDSFHTNTWTTQVDTLTDGSFVHQYPTLLGYIDNDNLADLVFIFRRWNPVTSTSDLTLRTKLSNGDGTWRAADIDEVTLNDGVKVHQYPALIGNVGDTPQDDLVFMFRQWNPQTESSNLFIRTKRSNGDGTFSNLDQTELFDGTFIHQYPALLGYVNNDIYADLVFIFRLWNPVTSTSDLTIRTKLSDGNGGFYAAAIDEVTLNDGPFVHQYPTLIGDVDGDSLDDLVFVFRRWNAARDASDLYIRTKRSHGNGYFSAYGESIFTDGPGVHEFPPLLGDVDGDGFADLVLVFRHWADGTRTLRVKLSNGDGEFRNPPPP